MSGYKPLVLYLIGLCLYNSILCDNYKNSDLQSDNEPLSDELGKNKLNDVHIKDENITEITKELLKQVTAVKNLQIEHCNVRSIEVGAFDDLSVMRNLSLRHNLLEEVKNGLFSHSFIEELDLSNNQIRTVEDDAFICMWNLRTLNLKNNKIEVFNNSWFEMSWYLHYVNFENNLIKKLPENILNRFWTSTVPFHFIFSHNKIEEIDEKAFLFIRKIDELYLDHNAIKTIKNNTFNGVQEIQDLRLDHNEIVCMTADISKVKKINVHVNPWDQQCLVTFKGGETSTTSSPKTTTRYRNVNFIRIG